MNRKEYITELLQSISEGVFEKEHILSLSLLCCIAGESIFMLGPPGTAKSMVARRIKEIFDDNRSFEYLMSRFSTPDEIFGPVSISKLKNEDVYERSVEGFLPTASVVFLDEIWKAGPAIQNALLTVINERIYQNGRCCIKLPMKILIAASNELPAEDEGLEALWDRFLVRVISNNIENEGVFYKMLLHNSENYAVIPKTLKITNELYLNWQAGIDAVEVSKNILQTLYEIRRCLKEVCKQEDIEPLDYYVSDRRWKKVVHILQTSAFLNDRVQVEHSDLLLLYHMLCNKTETMTKIHEIVSRTLFFDIIKAMDSFEKKLDKYLKTFCNKNTNFTIYDNFFNKLKDFPQGICYFHALDYKHLSVTKDSDAIMYFDNIKEAFYIRMFDTNKSASLPLFGNVEKIKIRRCPQGICVNGESYALVTRGKTAASGSDEHDIVNGFEQLMEESYKIGNDFKERLNIMLDLQNIFISNIDREILKGYIKPLEKEIRGLEVKMKGYSMSL